MSAETRHTHYDPYGPPRQVEGTLLDCDDRGAHSTRHSEVFAEGWYDPQLVPSESTGLPEQTEADVLAAFMEHRDPEVRPVITDVVADETFIYRVTITILNRYGSWHTEEWGLHADDRWRSTYNPHPGYEHTPPSCPNCGY